MESYKDKIKDFFGNLSADSIDLVEGFYAEDAKFMDPIIELKGHDDIKAYYAGMYQHVEEISFAFSEIIVDGNKVAAFWEMPMRLKKLNGGKPYTTSGMSHIHFDEAGKVSFHQDYYDVGEFIYERVPLLSTLIKYIKSKLKDH